MTERKITDEEVIKAFECHTKRNCGDCPMCGKGCADKLIEVAREFINRQKEKIEEVEAENRGLSICLDSAVKTALEIKSKSLTEYVTELERRLIAGGLGIAFVRSQMHKLLKEMKEGKYEC